MKKTLILSLFAASARLGAAATSRRVEADRVPADQREGDLPVRRVEQPLERPARDPHAQCRLGLGEFLQVAEPQRLELVGADRQRRGVPLGIEPPSAAQRADAARFFRSRHPVTIVLCICT